MGRYNWHNLNKTELNVCVKSYIKQEFIRMSFNVHVCNLSRRATGLIVRKTNGRDYTVQIRSIRRLHYTYFLKDDFKLMDDLLAAIALCYEGKEPQLYLIPSTAWRKPNALLVDRDYIDKESKPEWGLNLSEKNLQLLDQFTFAKMIKRL